MSKLAKHVNYIVIISVALLLLKPAMAQQPAIVQASSANNNADAELDKKANDWTGSLQLIDTAKAQKVRNAILTHLTAVRDWHNSHRFTLTPAGINPATGNKLSDMDRQIIVCSAKPSSIHTNLMTVLKAQLDSAQTETILDKYTIGKVAFTLKGYQAIIPDLTATEETAILANLKQAREQAIDYKGIKEVSAIFEIYKTKCEQYLNSNGRNWHQLFKAYVDKVKAQKEADRNKQ